MELEEGRACCISHAFCRAASSNPNKIAIIEANAFGGGGGGKEGEGDTHDATDNNNKERLRVYPGDVVYTYGHLQSAVNSLASRIVNILRGAHDPDLLTPTPAGISHEVDKSILSDRSSSIGHMTGERVCGQNDAVDIQNSVCLSEHNMDKQVAKDGGNSSFPNIIGIYIGPSTEYVVALLAVLQSGGAFLPIDPSWPKERVLTIVSASKVCLIISCHHASSSNVHENHENKWLLEGCKCSVLCLSYGYFKDAVEKGKSDFCMSWPCESQDQRLYCYVMYTSGSTGKPKGVCGTEKGLLNRVLWMETQYPFLVKDISCFKTAISFIDHLSEIFGPLLSSTTLVIPSFDKLRGNPLLVFDILKAYHVTRLITVPSLIRALLPGLQSVNGRLIQNSLRVLVLSGESFPIWLWEALHKILAETTILNLYGTTEVSGDCAYFDCKNLLDILEEEPLSSVPIGIPIPGCELLLAAETESLALSNVEGEILVGGKCLAIKYLDDALGSASKFVNLNVNCGVVDIASNYEVKDATYFRSGDFARKLSNGNYVIIGRKDRMIKVNGQRIALEEIEYNIRKHPDVEDAAASFHYGKCDNIDITGYIVLKGIDQSFVYRGDVKQNFQNHWNVHTRKSLSDLLKSWLEQRIPAVMIPSRFHFIRALPLLLSGKIDYEALPRIQSCIQETIEEYSGIYLDDRYIQIIKQIFRKVLMVEEISDSDDLFSLGGTSISAAHVGHTLGIDMRFIYKYPSPLKLRNAILQVPGLLESIRSLYHVSKLPLETSKYGKEKDNESALNLHVHNQIIRETPRSLDTGYKEVPSFFGSLMQVAEIVPQDFIVDTPVKSKLAKDSIVLDSYDSRPKKKPHLLQVQLQKNIETTMEHWVFSLNLLEAVAFSRFNKIISQGGFDNTLVLQSSHKIFRNEVLGSMCQLWKVLLCSCVDASPLVVIWNDKCHLFIGSHAHNFLCIDASSGEVQWETQLGGRVECTAAVTDDFTQVVVGCYNGTIYFLAFLTGKIIWSFQTGGEVKSQPIVDKLRGLIWCGSYDHNVYALDPQSQSCLLKLACGGSIFGSPAYDMVRSKVYVAATSGRVTAVNIEVTSMSVAWLYESQSPIFGSLTVESSTGYVICSMVSGNVIALSTSGTCVWQARTGGPIFSGPCISPAISSQVLVCSRDGFVHAFDLKQGDCLWKHFIGEPITSSAYVDETIELISQHENQEETIYRLVCVCSSSGNIHVLKVDSHAAQRYNIAAAPDFDSFEEAHNMSADNTMLTQTEGQNQCGNLNNSFTDMSGNCEDRNRNMQLKFTHGFAKLELPGEIFSSPVMVGGRIFVGCRDDHVYCIGIRFETKNIY